MDRNQRFSAFLILILFGLAPASASPAPPSPYDTSSVLNILQISTANGNQLQVAQFNGTYYNVDISGLRVDLECAQNAKLSTLANIRIDLIRQGCARITGVPASQAEETAQSQAQASHIGLWARPEPKPKPHPVSWFRHVVEWVKKHQLISATTIGLILTAAASPWLIRFVGWILAFFYRRRVDIIIAGARSAGKTGLWLAWKDEYNPGASGQITGLAPTAGVEKARIDDVTLEKWTLVPTLIDAGGAEPWHVLEAIQGTSAFKRAMRRRRKRVLLYVVAPCVDEQVATPEPFDENYIARQEGYTSLPMALIRQPDRKARPHLVIMFATKFDLLSKISPRDSDGKQAERMATTFRQHRELVESTCRDAKVPFTWIVGSAKRTWGIDQLRISLAKVLR
jgi:hypothetical protein